MKIYIEDEAISDILEMGLTRKNKYRDMTPAAVRKLQNIVKIMRLSDSPEELMKYPSLGYERLLGKRKGQESVRCDRRWRLIFTSNRNNDTTTIYINLIELSRHYE